MRFPPTIASQLARIILFCLIALSSPDLDGNELAANTIPPHDYQDEQDGWPISNNHRQAIAPLILTVARSSPCSPKRMEVMRRLRELLQKLEKRNAVQYVDTWQTLDEETKRILQALAQKVTNSAKKNGTG